MGRLGVLRPLLIIRYATRHQNWQILQFHDFQKNFIFEETWIALSSLLEILNMSLQNDFFSNQSILQFDTISYNFEQNQNSNLEGSNTLKTDLFFVFSFVAFCSQIV